MIKVGKDVMVKFSFVKNFVEVFVFVSACRRRRTWIGVRGGWIVVKDDVCLLLCVFEYEKNDEMVMGGDEVEMVDIL